MSEHMAGRISGNVPTLTDHFKQALSMTRSQLQSGPSALTSASQMGVNGLNVPGTLNVPMGAVPNLQPNVPLNTLANLHAHPDMVYGAGQNGLNPVDSSNGFVGAIQSYGKWILLLVVIMAGVGAYFWWRKRQGKDQNNVSEDMQMPSRRPINRSSGGMGGGMSIPIVGGGGGNGSVPPPFNPSRFQPSQPQNTQSPQPMPENLRDNEQHVAARGAEFSNPNMISHMMPMSTRVKPTEQTQNLPPQDIPNHQPPRVPHPVNPQPINPQPSAPPINIPVSQPPPVNIPVNIPVSQPPPVNIPVSQPPTHVPDLPISAPPTQLSQSNPPQPNADPNFTAV